MTGQAIITQYFQKLGLEPEIAALYLALHTHGPQSISSLSRHSGVERTRIYRLLDQLTQSSLVEVETAYKRHIYKAAPVANLRILLSRKDQELRSLHDELDSVEQLLAARSLQSPATRVQYYRGAEGIKQMFWNETKAGTEVVGLFHDNMQGQTDSAFFERWVERCNQRGLAARGLVSDHFIAGQQAWYRTRHNPRLVRWQARYVPDSLFRITHNTIVYDDVTAHYQWHDAEIFGIEIYNQLIAGTQRQFFELLWRQAQPIDDVAGPPA